MKSLDEFLADLSKKESVRKVDEIFKNDPNKKGRITQETADALKAEGVPIPDWVTVTNENLNPERTFLVSMRHPGGFLAEGHALANCEGCGHQIAYTVASTPENISRFLCVECVPKREELRDKKPPDLEKKVDGSIKLTEKFINLVQQEGDIASGMTALMAALGSIIGRVSGSEKTMEEGLALTMGNISRMARKVFEKQKAKK